MNNEKIVISLVITGSTLILVGVLILLIDFYNDYKCSTTTDINYWKDHNCMKYYERNNNDK